MKKKRDRDKNPFFYLLDIASFVVPYCLRSHIFSSGLDPTDRTSTLLSALLPPTIFNALSFPFESFLSHFLPRRAPLLANIETNRIISITRILSLSLSVFF